jgi:adenylate cyclase
MTARARGALSIAWLLPLVLGLLTTVTVFPVLLAGFLGTQDVSQRLLRDRGELLIRAIARPVESLLLPVVEAVDRAIEDLENGTVVSADDEARLHAFAQGLLDAQGHLAGVSFVALDGSMRTWSRDGVKHVSDDENLAFRLDLLDKAKTGAQGSWSRPFVSSSNGEMVISYRAPTRRQGEVTGLVAAAVSLNSLSSDIVALAAEFEVTPFVLAGRSDVVVHASLTGDRRATAASPPSIDTVGDPVLAAIWLDPRPFTSALPMRGASGHWSTIDGTDYSFSYVDIPLTGSPMLAGYYVPSELSRRDRHMRYYIAAIGSAVLLAALGAAWWLGRRLARPIVALGEASQAIGDFRFERGDLTVWESSRVREIAETAGAFGTMTRALHSFERYVPKQLVRELMTLGESGSRPVSRQLTVVFLDLEGYTRFSAGRSAQEVAGYLNEIFAHIGPVIEARGGTIDKYTGDGLMAFWGAPRPDSDHAANALECALELADRLGSQQLGPASLMARDCRVRIGLHTGELVVGDLGYADRIDYTVIGDVVNRAKRIEGSLRGIAPQEQVVIAASETTIGAASSTVKVRQVERLNIDGAWRIVRDVS